MEPSLLCRVLLLIALLHARAAAQLVSIDSATMPEHRSFGRGVWVSAGPGVTGSPHLLSGRISLSYASGALLVVGRGAGATDTDGYSIGDMALLVGARTAGPVFATAAVGPAWSSWRSDCVPGFCTRKGNSGAVGFDFGVHATLIAAGVGLNMFGVAGPAEASYWAFGFSVHLGWFGKWQ